MRKPKITVSNLQRYYSFYSVIIGLIWKACVKFRQVYNYTITISSGDPLWRDIHEWVLSSLPEKSQRSLIALTETKSEWDYRFYKYKRDARIRYLFDGMRKHYIQLDGCRIQVAVTQADKSFKPLGPGLEDILTAFGKKDQLVFTVNTLAAREALRAKLDSLASKRYVQDKSPALWMPHYDSWQDRSDLPPRAIESVILPNGQLDNIREDLKAFLDSEDEYVIRGIPYHRAYLFHGPPGTGKSSLAKALASDLALDLWYLPLADIKKDMDILNLLTRITPRSILLLEDIDVFHLATKREEKDGGGTTLSGLLNALDGISTPHGLVTIMTTNNIEILDTSLTRAGRCDRKEYLGYLTDDQTKKIFDYFYFTEAPFDVLSYSVEGKQISPAELIEIMKRNPHNSKQAIEDLCELSQITKNQRHLADIRHNEPVAKKKKKTEAP